MSPDKEDSFAAMFEQQPVAPRKRRAIRVGDRVDAVVIQVGRDAVFVEIVDGKVQAFLEAAELREDDGTMSVKVGDKLSAHVVEVNEDQGILRLGRSLGKPGSLAALETAKAAGLGVEGKVTGVNKGGLEVELAGTRAFCPMSQVDARRIEDEDAKALIGQTLKFLVTDIKDGGKNVVLSRRGLLQREASETVNRALSDIIPGAVLRGSVTGIRDFGAFVDLGGIEGLIPRSEIGHDRSVQIGDALKPGDTVEVQVLEVKDVEPARPGGPTKKITLSLKALAADPWTELDIVEGRVIKGTVVRITEFGRFIRLAPAIEGLLHISELGKNGAPGMTGSEGEEILVVVKKIDRTAKKISLVPAPDGAEAGTTIATSSASVKVNSVVTGVVERIETYGIFVQIDGTKGRAGRGLVPQAELGVPRGTDLRKSFPEGTKVTAKVLETGEGRLRLSIKGAKDAEERADYEAARGKANVPASLGTFADLLKGRKL
ncbi:MAG TPA: S1 RNA-binding domain-containing protein [Labilithrix sp.]|nr:S1 RNA-binding domain-containing protein [Labilithrix sp.]